MLRTVIFSSALIVFAYAPTAAASTFPDHLTKEDEVVSYFSDVPAMIEIARCESEFRQYAPGGAALHGGLGNRMIGAFQIYSDIHANDAASLGFNIYTLAGNLGYARHLYETQGTTPWNASAHCWRERVDAIHNSVSATATPLTDSAATTQTPSIAELEQKIEMLTQQLYLLQIQLLSRQLEELNGRLALR
jgi:hypothetical protein